MAARAAACDPDQTSKTRSDILAQVENVERELADATEAYERSLLPGGADPFAREKHQLASKIQALRAELDPLEARLLEINNTPPPAQLFKLTVARMETLTNGAGRLLTESLADKKSQELHAQPFAELPRETQKILLNRSDVSVAKDVAAAGFTRFGRQPEEVRTSEQAKSTAQRITEAIKLIADTIRSNS
jgi:hypothetical protein